MGVPVISVGNLSVGGSGKTPLVTALASRYENVAVVLRGYGRESLGLVVVKDTTSILTDVTQSGDEAMIYAKKLPHAIVIVSEDRIKGIQKAKELGAKVVFLDDAYSKHFIKKLDLLIDVQTPNNFCLPSGAFREKLWAKKEVVVVREGVEFTRHVEVKDKCDKMSLLTAIARPQRLDRFLPAVVSKNYFEDHHSFRYDEVRAILERDGSEALLVTLKDYVKLEHFGVKLALLDLEVKVDEKIYKTIGRYIENKN